ncbi:MAG TPA: hypothetical protein VIC54_05845 [Terriglobales bacterium]|jgi:hypothetical protein
MKLGSEKKGEVIALVVLLAVAAVMLWRALAPVASPAAPAPAAAAVAVPAAAPASAPAVPGDPTLHLDELTRLRAIEYTGTGRDLFHFGAAPLPAAQRAVASVASAKAAAAAARSLPPPGPPPPPPIPLKFYGFAQASGTPERIFLQMGEDNFVVSQGETIAHRYLIENIGKVSVRVKDLQTQSEQELPLQQG